MEKYLLEIREILLKNTGIRISDDKNSFLLSTINQILQKDNLSVENYLTLLKTNHNKIIELATYFTVQETSFYRNKDHFNTLKNKILPALKEIKRDKTISILSAGCATGEEPYTIAMIVKDFFGQELTNWQINIYAIDISKEALEEAKKGIYSEYKMKNIDNYYIEKFFDIELRNSRQYFIVKDDIKKMVSFYHENLLSENLINSLKLDVIFCENVIIYFDYTSTEKLINKFYHSLNMPGYLFLGYSETLNMIKHHFNLCWNNQTYYYIKEEICYKKEESQAINKDICYDKNFKDERASYEDFVYSIMKSYLKNDKDSLLKLYKELLQIYSVNPDFIKDEKIFLIFGEFFIDNNDISTAKKMCEMALEKYPSSLDAHNLNGYIFLLENEPLQALFSLNISFKNDSSNKITLYLLYKAYESLKNQEKKSEIIELLKKTNIIQDDSFFPYNSLRKIQFYGAINKILGEQQ
ncbi:MAG: protein-glutamate O-methyltransferase CheR [Brevinematales bacterium]|nr:protein-glutamate O-methyltransferase CheR [Brevinematales bacterium]